MNGISARGFTLALRPFSESDKIVQLYTLQWGLLRALVKGARKPKSKLAPALELFSESDLMLTKKPSGDLYLLTQVKVARGHGDLRKDLGSITRLQVLADLLIQALPGTEPHPEVYHLLRGTLEALEAHPEAGETLLIAFALKFLECLGHPLELSACAHCGSELPKRPVFLVPHRGGALCADCGPAGTSRLSVSPAGLGILTKIRTLSMDKVDRVKVPPIQARALFLAVMDYAERTLERELKTIPYYLTLEPLPG
ncbi:MAG TPA: DNA repair protein RecO [bacterium]|nr:DNA repair protein RecO [bacterium]